MKDRGQISRRDWLRSASAFGFSTAGCALLPAGILAAERSGVLDIGSRRQLFLDDFILESREGVFRTLNQPLKSPHNPLVEMDQPWEADMHFANSTNVIYDEQHGRFKMWNQVVNYDWSERLLAYYESDDGLSWRKPEVGQFPYHSPAASGKPTRKHNFVFGRPHPATAPGVFKDRHAKRPEERYKMLYRRSKPQSGVWAAFSSDGIHWTDYPHPDVNPVYVNNDTHQVVFWDRKRQKYVAHMRLKPPIKLGAGPSKTPTRSVGIATSEDFLHWDAPRRIRDPVEVNRPHTLLMPDERDGMGISGFYSMETLPYEDVYLAFLPVYHIFPGMERHLPPRRGNAATPWLDTIDIQLAFSRDGQSWQRIGDRRTFLPLGAAGSFDAGMVFVSQLPVVRQDRGEIWIYYVGYRKGHWAVRRGENQASAIGLAVLRLDGFVSLAAGDGSVLTKPLTFTGDRLVINAHTSASGGMISVEVVDAASGDEIPGFSQSDCDVFSGDAISQVVTWNGKSDLSHLAGRPVQLRIRMRAAKLYAFQFRSVQEPRS